MIHKLAIVALLVFALACPARADMIVRTTDGRTYRLPVGRENLKSITFSGQSQITPAPTPPKNKPGGQVKPQVWLDQQVFQPGQAIRVHFTAPAEYDQSAWVGIVPSRIDHGSEMKNDRYDLAFQHLKKRTRGTLTFKAPTAPGQYDFRMHNRDRDGVETAFVSFTVAGAPAAADQPRLWLDGQVFRVGQRIQVHFTAPAGYDKSAWIGIIPQSVPHGSEATNDRSDLAYQYLNKRTEGTFVFVAPNKPGRYDFRMNDRDNGGRETASVSFTVQ